GRVIVAGGDGVFNVEFYSPPYMFRERPQILSAPATIQYGQSFMLACDTGLAGSIRRVALIRLGGATHSVAMDQRYVTLHFATGTNGTIAALAPELANAAPRGYYMLVVMAENGAPSVARIVSLS